MLLMQLKWRNCLLDFVSMLEGLLTLFSHYLSPLIQTEIVYHAFLSQFPLYRLSWDSRSFKFFVSFLLFSFDVNKCYLHHIPLWIPVQLSRPQMTWLNAIAVLFYF